MSNLEESFLPRPSLGRLKRRSLDEAPKNLFQRLRRLAPDYFKARQESGPPEELPDHVTPFEKSFSKLLQGAQYVSETVGPYARLHLTVHRAVKLLAQDYIGTSDPYVEVYVNDMKRGQSRHVSFTLNPEWNFSEVVDIWSPFSIITLRIVDWDRVSKDDPIGFVDFCVADLEPNGTGVRGWLELRKMKHFQTNAKKRFLQHRRLRDDEISEEEQDEDLKAESSEILDSMSGGSLSPANALKKLKAMNTFHFSERKAQLRSSLKAMRKARLPCCHVPPRDTDGPTSPFFRRRKPLNAGEVEITLRLETSCASSLVVGRPPWVLYTAVMAPERIGEVVQDAEWFACCLPEPIFKENDSWSLASIKLFAEEATELIDMLLQAIVLPHVNIFLLILGWYYWPLSLCVLLYFWALVFWASDMLWSLPLLVLVLFILLRDQKSCNWLLAHPKVVPLNHAGLEMVTFLKNTTGICVWLKRLVKDRGGWVEDYGELKDFAKRVHKHGKPAMSFKEMLSKLEEKPWITWQGKPKKCHCGSVLEFWGNGAIRLDDGWSCHGLRSKHPGEMDGRFCSAGLYQMHGQHLGRQRYHCPTCARRKRPCDVCGVCARGGRGYYLTSLLDSSTLNQLPIWRSLQMKAVKEFICEGEPVLDYFREVVKRLLRLLDDFRNPHDDDLFACMSLACLLLSIALYVMSMFDQPFMLLVLGLLQLAVLLIVTATFLLFTAPVRRLRTAYNATRLLARCHRWRRRGGCNRWHFFRPSEGHQQRQYLRVETVETIESGGIFPLSPYGVS